MYDTESSKLVQAAARLAASTAAAVAREAAEAAEPSTSSTPAASCNKNINPGRPAKPGLSKKVSKNFLSVIQ